MEYKKNWIIVTGASGFIGAGVVLKLLKMGYKVIGIDNQNSYYDTKLKKDRIKHILSVSNYSQDSWLYFNFSIENKQLLENIFHKYNPEIVINLAAQAGVRYSIINPDSYINSNIIGFANILECCRKFEIKHLIYASSSSVYGGNKKLPYKESDPVDHPVSLYAATKKSNELMAHSYSHLFNIPCTGLRFFTVYGPWGRPDMAPMIFTKAILNSEPLKVFNFGKMKRDFTYIDDITEGVIKCIFNLPKVDKNFDKLKPDPSKSYSAPYRIFNIGNNKPIELIYFIGLLEETLGKKAIKCFEPMQPGDVKETFADIDSLSDWIDFKPKINIEEGVELFVNWYKNYYF